MPYWDGGHRLTNRQALRFPRRSRGCRFVQRDIGPEPLPSECERLGIQVFPGHFVPSSAEEIKVLSGAARARDRRYVVNPRALQARLVVVIRF